VHPGGSDPDGTPCTLALEPEGDPYGSFVTVAFEEGNPVFLISGLAEQVRKVERAALRESLAPSRRGEHDGVRRTAF
jgi:hypothetical protein